MENPYVQEKFGNESSAEKWSTSGLYNEDANEATDAYSDKLFRMRYVLEGVPRATEKDATLLDLGCATGAFFPALNEKGYSITGVDSVPFMVESARAFCREQQIDAKVQIDDCNNLSFDSGYFDACIAVGLIEHQVEDGPTLKELNRVIKTGGTLVITTRNRSCPYVRLLGLVDAIAYWRRYLISKISGGKSIGKKVSHGREHATRIFARKLGEYGFAVKQIRYSHFYLLPPPLDRLFPKAQSRYGKRMESLNDTVLGWLGSTTIYYTVRK